MGNRRINECNELFNVAKCCIQPQPLNMECKLQRHKHHKTRQKSKDANFFHFFLFNIIYADGHRKKKNKDDAFEAN